MPSRESSPQLPHSSPATPPPPRRRSTPRSNGASARQAAPPSTDLRAAQRREIDRLRREACEQARPALGDGAAPIRVMARMVAGVEAACRERGLPPELLRAEVVNRTIGDVDLRAISASEDGPEYVPLADEMGLALPDEQLDGYVASGETYHWIHARMLDFERTLRARHFDLRMYDLSGSGNPLLREMLAAHAERQWGFTLPPDQILLSLGSLDGLDKFWRGYAMALRQRNVERFAVLFPAPGFNVPEWQAVSLGIRLHRIQTRSEDSFKLTPTALSEALTGSPDIRVIYLTVSNNPTAFAYSPAELEALFEVVLQHDVLLAADLAYIGTGDPAEDRARMRTFARPEVLRRSVLVNSFSKTHSLTGDRCGWVGCGDPALATAIGPGWTNSTASLPAEWQLRYMAYVQLIGERPELSARIRALYQHRRARLVRQLHALQQRHSLFARILHDDGGTVYNWSQLCAGEDVFSLFAATGIAGVPGSAFGYSDDYVRLSVGVLPVPEVR